MICEICGKEIGIKGFGLHVKSKHKVDVKEYYNKYVGPIKYCVYCGKEGEFKFTTGYKNYCCREHYYHTDEYKEANEKISKSYEKRDMKLWMEKRISTNMKKYDDGVEHTSQIPGSFEKACKTQIEKYGEVKNFSNKKQRASAEKAMHDNLEEVNNKRRLTYWDKVRETCEKEHHWNTIEERSAFYNYILEVKKYTRLNSDELFESWVGTDFYTGEKLTYNKDVIIYNPTIDHKISVLYGFNNNIGAEEISKLENLCICSRSINSKKGYKNMDEFIKLLKEENNEKNDSCSI